MYEAHSLFLVNIFIILHVCLTCLTIHFTAQHANFFLFSQLIFPFRLLFIVSKKSTMQKSIIFQLLPLLLPAYFCGPVNSVEAVGTFVILMKINFSYCVVTF